MMVRVWAVTKNLGGYNAVRPVLEELRLRNHGVLHIANGKSVDILSQTKKNPPYLRISSVDDLLYLTSNGLITLPDIFVTSACSNGGVGQDLIPALRELGVPTVLVTDFWTGAQVKDFVNKEYWPDAVCVQDNLSRDILLDAWHGYPYSSVYVTGQPAFDKLALFDTAALLQKFTSGLTLFNEFTELEMPYAPKQTFDENIPIVLFAGQLQGTAQALNALIRSLNMMPYPVNLVISYHPRLISDSREEERPIREAKSLFKNGKILPTYPLSSDEWSCVANLVVSMTSTVLATAGHFRKNCISILFPEVEKGLDPRWGMPYERLGTAAVARSQAVLNKLVVQALFKGGLGLREDQEKHFILDVNSAKRVADVVENTLRHEYRNV